MILPLFHAKAQQPDSQQIYLQCLTNFESYAQSIWHASSTIPDSGYWGDGGSTGNGGIRGNSGIALAYAVLCIALPNDPQFTNRLTYVRQALNYDYNTHVTGAYNTTDGHQWGWSGDSTDWQTPEWSGSMGLACILVQGNLPAATIQGVRRVVVSEANHRASLPPSSGHVSDTQAESDAWQGNILALAAAWMSTSNNAPTWLLAAKQYLANSYTIAGTNADSLSSWVTTTNLYDDWALENHGFFHPTYEMVAGMSEGDSLLMARMANPSVAAQLQPFAEHNVMAVWTNILSGMIMDSGDFAYPDGLDWELHDYEQYSYIAWLAAHFDDPVARWDDGRLAQLTRYRQQINGNGEFVGPSGGGFYREAVEARRVAICWLQWNFADYPNGFSHLLVPAFENLTGVAALSSRGTNGFVSISYGPQTNGSPARIMATIEPLSAVFPSSPYVTTPRLPGIIGLGIMGSPTGGRLVTLTTNQNGFFAELQLTNGLNGTTEVYFNDTGDSVGIVEIPQPKAGFANGATASFSTGIENDPLCGGSRLLEWSNASATMANRSGTKINVTNNWICVSGIYGIAAGPAGNWNYATATGYNRLGAAEDTLAFLYTNSLAPRFAVYFPGKNALQTSNLAAQVTWTLSATNASLTFPATGGVASISAMVPPPVVSTLPPYQLGIAAITASSYQSSYPPTNAADNNLSTFWVSYGTSAGQGPAPSHPEWLRASFSRQCAVSEFQVLPRTLNGGYGPANVQLWLNGSPVTTNTMSATATFDQKMSPPLYATNAELYITGSYDAGNTNSPRNVQVVELEFFERAQPGTFGDWLLQHFTDVQLTNSLMAAANADPDGDGVPNLLEFATGGDPLIPDATNAVVSGTQISPGQFGIHFQERNSLGNVVRQFQNSPDLLNWSNATPVSVTPLHGQGQTTIYQAIFSLQPFPQFFRLTYTITN
ncbi:MAG TPA: discoidin domain-containing protein [Verrucomicrobiae bacterium]|nr:discoidin domain-containing protein [Verrucomicrobiae bacterium]